MPKGEINARDIHRNINHKQLLNTLINAPSCAIKKKRKSHVWGDSGLHCQFFPLGWIISTNYKCVETSPIEGGKKKKNPDSTSPQASSLPSCFFLTDLHLLLILLPLLLLALEPAQSGVPAIHFTLPALVLGPVTLIQGTQRWSIVRPHHSAH